MIRCVVLHQSKYSIKNVATMFGINLRLIEST